MMKHTFKRKILIGSLLVFSSLTSTGCFELNFKDTQQYYDLFSDTVYLFYSNDDGTESAQTVKSLEDDLFNDDTVNDVHKVETIEDQYYEYLVIQPTDTVEVQDFALFVKTTETVVFETRIYLIKNMPALGEIRSFGLGTKDAEGHDITYGDDYSKPISTTIITAKQNLWGSVYVNSWEVDGKETKYVDITTTDFIVVQFLNNTGYGVDLGYEPVKFSIVNLMVSPKNDKYAIEED